MNFKDYLDARKETPSAFAKRANLSQVPIYKLYKGGTIRKDTAKRIYRVTKKDVTLEALGYTEVDGKVVPLEIPVCDTGESNCMVIAQGIRKTGIQPEDEGS